MENMTVAFPNSAPLLRAAMIRAMYRTLGANVYEFLNIEGASRSRIESLIEDIEGESFLVDALKEGKGIIAITGHIGCWELLGAYLVSRGYTVSVVAKSLSQAKWQERLETIRFSVGVKTINRDSGAREMLQALRNGEILGILIDQNTRVNGLYVPFFKKLAHTPSAVAKLAIFSGARIVPMAIYLNSRGKHVVRILEPITSPDASTDRAKAVEAITAECSLAIETLIRYDPKQWIWWHDRWPQKEQMEVNYATRN